MAASVGVSSKGTGSGVGTAVSAAVTTQVSGSTFVAFFQSDTTHTGVTDSKGNTYTPIGTLITNSSINSRLYYCQNGTGGASHTCTGTGQTGDHSILFVELLGVLTTGVLDQVASILDTSTPFTVTSGTTTQSDEISISAMSGNSTTTATHAESTGYTISQEVTTGGPNWTCGIAYKVLSATGTQTPSWTEASGTTAGVHVATFKATASYTLEQEGFIARNDNGNETTATAYAAADTNFTAPLSTNIRLRMLINATLDPASAQYRLDYKKSSESTYTPVLLAAASFPTFQAAGTAVTGTGNVSPTWPAHAVGDIGLLVIESCGGEVANLGTAAGFVAVTGSPIATGTTTLGTQISVYWCRATTTSMATPTVTDPGNHATAQIVTFRGCVAEGNPWDITGTAVKAVASTSASAPAVTTTVANTLVVSVIGRDVTGAGAFFSAEANASLASLTERTDAGSISGNGGGWALYTGTKATAGSTGTLTATVTSSINASIVIALRPQPSPILMGASANITASGDNTTAQLTAPSGKTTGDFVTGRMQDDENPADAVDITSDDYTELEWSLIAASPAVNGDIYQFRVTSNGTALNTYTFTPEWTIGTPGAAVGALFFLLMGIG